ncbi:MAG: LPS export ABC transporter periplasmic protein LptC [Gammaproteobacteria bacterium]|nr:LPS export ABC transporter periplasmic protein LptC [Gammaproteobacteria bacterium]MBL6818811.1 LPS export ABC transporter periplasmic protein LptC [Gammaproteobacteria bacterium]MBL6898585.1 LPS export ABC transporter periplasmic protein LptC [Gammaproteobacteria bacterium]
MKKYIILIACLILSSNLESNELSNPGSVKSQVLNFSTIKNDKDMKIQWSLEGELMKKYNNNITFVSRPELKLYRLSSRTIVKSNTAIDPSGDMDEIYLKNNVYVKKISNDNSPPVRMYTSYAILYVSRDLIETDKGVTIITENSKTTGIGMSADLDAGLIVLLEDAKREIKDEEGTRIIQGNKMIYNTNTHEWTIDDSPSDIIKKKIKKKVTTTFNIK